MKNCRGISVIRFFIAILFVVCVISLIPVPLYAAGTVLGNQTLSNFGFSTVYPVREKEAVGGDIISIISKDSNNLMLTNIPYDTNMFGVIVDNPNILMRTVDATGSAIMRTGQTFVNVTTQGGEIRIGDFITSSTLPGKGQRADNVTQGYVLGVALSTFDGTDGTVVTVDKKEYKLGTIQVAIGIGPASPIQVKAAGGVLGTIQFMITSVLYNIRTSIQLEKIIRFTVAALVALLTIYINFRTFGKNITQGIESIGRNPLAKASIQGMIILNTVMIGVVSLAGIVLALVIISL